MHADGLCFGGLYSEGVTGYDGSSSGCLSCCHCWWWWWWWCCCCCHCCSSSLLFCLVVVDVVLLLFVVCCVVYVLSFFFRVSLSIAGTIFGCTSPVAAAANALLVKHVQSAYKLKGNELLKSITPWIVLTQVCLLGGGGRMGFNVLYSLNSISGLQQSPADVPAVEGCCALVGAQL